MAHASMHARTIVDQWLEGEVGKCYLLDLGEADYGMGYQDAQKEIFEFFKARDVTFSPTIWGLLNPVTPDDHQEAEDATLNASVDTIGGEISMDNAYLDSSANLDSVVGMDRASVPTLTEVGQGDMAAIEEEDPSDALQLNCQRSRSSERNLPTGFKVAPHLYKSGNILVAKSGKILATKLPAKRRRSRFHPGFGQIIGSNDAIFPRRRPRACRRPLSSPPLKLISDLQSSRKASESFDVFSCGILLLELASGKKLIEKVSATMKYSVTYRSDPTFGLRKKIQ
nr:uncharacterized protein LOC109180246 [Ipomoea trifida]